MSEPDKIGAAILGFYAAIKICEKDGYDWQDVASLVEPIAKKHAAIANAQPQGDE